MTEIKPYDTEDMIWSNEKQRYILTVNADSEIKKVYSQDLGVIDRKLDETSLLVYSFIRTKTHSRNVNFFNFILAKTEEYRKVIHDAMLEQLRADMESGYNDLQKQIPLNLQTFQGKDRDFFNRNLVCPMCENILSTARPFNLLYVGDYGIRKPVINFYKEIKEYHPVQEIEIEELSSGDIDDLIELWGE